MIKSIFFRALTLLGLTFVLIGCGAADPGEGGTGTPGTPGAAGLSVDDVTKEVEKLIRDSKGTVDLADGQAVAAKIVSIMKASQPLGSCSLFNQGIFPGIATLAVAAKQKPLVIEGNAYTGGSGTLTVTLTATIATIGIIPTEGVIEYKYDKYSIDGIYFLNGSLKMSPATATAPATPGVSDFTATASELKLTMGTTDGTGEKKIAKIVFAAGFKPTFTAAANALCGAHPPILAAMANAVTITAETDAKFTEVELSTSAAGSATAYPAGTNVGLLMALIGPRYS